MARTIKKKAFDDDLMLSDDFDESVLEKIERQFQAGDTPASGGNTPLRGSGSSPSQAGSFSLDDFETESLPESDLQSTSDLQQPYSGHADSRGSKADSTDPVPGKARSMIPVAKLVVIAVVGGVLVFAAIVFVAGLVYSPRQQLPIITMIRHTVPVPISTETHEFLIRANSSKDTILVNMGIEVSFYGVRDEDRPEEEQILLRDAIFRFLSDGQPTKNSQKYWEKIVSNDLQPYLKTSFPKKGLKSVRLIRFARL